MSEIVVTFLALLELVKRYRVEARQEGLFFNIEMIASRAGRTTKRLSWSLNKASLAIYKTLSHTESTDSNLANASSITSSVSAMDSYMREPASETNPSAM